MKPSVRQAEIQRATQKAEKYAFNEQLAGHPRRPGADRRAYRKLVLAAGGLHQQQIRPVDAVPLHPDWKHARHVGVGLRERNAGLESRDALVVEVVAGREIAAIEALRQDHVGREVEECEVLRHDADHLPRS